MIEWNGLIPIALGTFVVGVATLLVAVGLTLIDWQLSDRTLLEETRTLLSLGSNGNSSQKGQNLRPIRARSSSLNRRNTRVS
jgi:hypothetical protein